MKGAKRSALKNGGGKDGEGGKGTRSTEENLPGRTKIVKANVQERSHQKARGGKEE